MFQPKGVNFAVSPQQLPVVDCTATQSAIRNNDLAEDRRTRMTLMTAINCAKAPPPNLTLHQMKAIISLSRDENITISPADKGRCKVGFITAVNQNKVVTLLNDSTIYKPLKRDPAKEEGHRPPTKSGRGKIYRLAFLITNFNQGRSLQAFIDSQ